MHLPVEVWSRITHVSHTLLAVLIIFNDVYRFQCTHSKYLVTHQVTEFLGAGARQWGFLVRGLRQVEPKLQALNIPFYMMYGNAEDNLPKLVDDLGAGLLICDFVPVHAARAWRENVGTKLSSPACFVLSMHFPQFVCFSQAYVVPLATQCLAAQKVQCINPL